jgi:signal transduction histidine kinase
MLAMKSRTITEGRSNSYARTILDYRRYATFSWDWSWRRCILFAIFGSLIGVWAGVILGVVLADRHVGFTAGLGTAQTLVVAMCVGPLAASWIRSRGWPRRREIVGVVAAVILGVAIALAFKALRNKYVDHFMVPGALPTQVTANRFLLPPAIESSPLPLLGNCLLFLLLGGGLALPSYFTEQRRRIEAAREREVGELQLQKQEADLQMLVLQAQIEPHFLFNTLASLRSLMRQDVDRAEAMVDALVGHLRSVIPVFRERKGHSILSEQLRICSSYLELIRVRLADRLRFTIDVPETLRSVPFPPLILLTLVENAVKHGIEPQPGQGIIRIDARRERHLDGTHIRVSVTDNGAGLSPGLGHGVGLSNVRAQLALKYGGRAALSLMSGIDGGAVASIDIPEFEASESAISAKASAAL